MATKITLFNNSKDAVSVDAGEVIFKEGDPGDVMYAVLSGRLDVIHKDAVIYSVGEGDIIGEMAIVDKSPRSATLVAAEPSSVVKVDEKRFLFLVQEHPTFAMQVMRIMADRLRQANDRELDR